MSEQESLFAGDGSSGETPTQAAERLAKENDALKHNMRWVLRHVADQGRCRSCGEEIYWVVVKGDKRMPLNPDGVSHFATCPDADRWRRR